MSSDEDPTTQAHLRVMQRHLRLGPRWSIPGAVAALAASNIFTLPVALIGAVLLGQGLRRVATGRVEAGVPRTELGTLLLAIGLLPTLLVSSLTFYERPLEPDPWGALAVGGAAMLWLGLRHTRTAQRAHRNAWGRQAERSITAMQQLQDRRARPAPVASPEPGNPPAEDVQALGADLRPWRDRHGLPEGVNVEDPRRPRPPGMWVSDPTDPGAGG